MNWRLFRKDDPNTWPEVDCPMLVYINNQDYYDFLTIAKWVTWCNDMCDMKADEFLYIDECYYQYIGYIPDGYKTMEVQMCTTTAPCEFEDDGYCMHPNSSCPYCLKVNNYTLNDNKRIWKEFK